MNERHDTKDMTTETDTNDWGLMAQPQALPMQHETAAVAAAEGQKAMIQARFTVAINRPRDWDVVRERLKKECGRRGFAECAMYSLPRGYNTSIEGLSIRFAEEALRCMGNLDVKTPTTFEDEHKRIINVVVMDLESNSAYESSVLVEKTLERRKTKESDEILGNRVNSNGDAVYIIKATEGELQIKQGAQISKAIRNNVLRHLPGWLADECKAWVKGTLRKADQEDPDAARRRMLDRFGEIKVSVTELKTYLGKDPDLMTLLELEELRDIWNAIHSGQTTWEAVREAKLGEEEQPKKAPSKRRGTAAAKEAAGIKEEPKPDLRAEIKRMALEICNGDANEAEARLGFFEEKHDAMFDDWSEEQVASVHTLILAKWRESKGEGEA